MAPDLQQSLAGLGYAISMKQPNLILILGLPGAGKTTLAKKLATKLNLPLIIKDDLKVLLLDTYGWKDREASVRAGGVSYKIMDYVIEEQLRVGNSLIVESTFDPKFDDARFQTWEQKYHVRYAQLYCYADADVIRKRFRDRSKTDDRHVSYTEGEAGLQNLEKYIQQGINPLAISGSLIEVDTTDFNKVDFEGLLVRLREYLAG